MTPWCDWMYSRSRTFMPKKFKASVPIRSHRSKPLAPVNSEMMSNDMIWLRRQSKRLPLFHESVPWGGKCSGSTNSAQLHNDYCSSSCENLARYLWPIRMPCQWLHLHSTVASPHYTPQLISLIPAITAWAPPWCQYLGTKLSWYVLQKNTLQDFQEMNLDKCF